MTRDQAMAEMNTGAIVRRAAWPKNQKLYFAHPQFDDRGLKNVPITSMPCWVIEDASGDASIWEPTTDDKEALDWQAV